MKHRILLLSLILLSCFATPAMVQDDESELYDTLVVVSDKRVEKKYTIYFDEISSRIKRSIYGNDEVLEQMKAEIRGLIADKITPDSLVILSVASPDGDHAFNKGSSLPPSSGI